MNMFMMYIVLKAKIKLIKKYYNINCNKENANVLINK